MSTPTDAENAPPLPSRRFGSGALAAASVAGLVVGVGAGLAVGGLGGSAEPTAQDDLDAMCRYVENIDTPVERDEDMLTSPLLWRLTAVGGLAVAAGYGDGDDALRELGIDVIDGSRRLDENVLNEGLEGLRDYCG